MDLHTLEATDSWAWPDGAGDYLMDLLRAPGTPPEDAVLAAELAGDYVVAGDDMAETLLTVIIDEDRPVTLRRAAAASLGPMLEGGASDEPEDGEAGACLSRETIESVQSKLQTLFGAHTTTETIRRAALEASVHDPRPWHAAAVRAAYEHPAEASQVSAMYCMGFLHGFENQILAGLRHDHEEVRYHAVVAAGNCALPAAWSYVAALASDNDCEKTLRLAAIEAVAAIRPEGAYEVLHRLLQHPDEDIASGARDALILSAAQELEAEALEEGDEGDEADGLGEETPDPTDGDDAHHDADGEAPPTRRHNGHSRS